MSDNSTRYLRIVDASFEPAPVTPSTFKTKKESSIVEVDEGDVAGAAMSEMNREEVKARLEASEARVTASNEAIKGEFVALRGEFVGLRHEVAAGLDKILLAVERGKSERYASGYKIITWTIGTVVALAGLGIAFYRTFIVHT